MGLQERARQMLGTKMTKFLPAKGQIVRQTMLDPTWVTRGLPFRRNRQHQKRKSRPLALTDEILRRRWQKIQTRGKAETDQGVTRIADRVDREDLEDELTVLTPGLDQLFKAMDMAGVVHFLPHLRRSQQTEKRVGHLTRSRKVSVFASVFVCACEFEYNQRGYKLVRVPAWTTYSLCCVGVIL